jgi:ABC-type sugar transport system substrate-binding protein
VVSFNDDAAIGAIRAIRALGLEQHAIVVGQGCDRVARAEMRRPDSLLMGSTAFMPERYGARLLQIAGRILAHEPVPPAVYGDHVFVTPATVDLHYPGEAETVAARAATRVARPAAPSEAANANAARPEEAN